MDLKMAWRNVWRNPRRTILTISAIAFAVILLVFMLSFQFGSYETMINSAVKNHVGHLQIQAVGYLEKSDIRLVIDDPDPIGSALEALPEVAAYSFRAEGFAIVSAGSRTAGVLVSGVDPVREAGLSSLKTSVVMGSYFKDADPYQVLLGGLLARHLGVEPGDELTLLGQGRDGSVAAGVVTVAGIVRSGMDEFDRKSIYLPLPTFQEMYFMGKAVHRVVVTCRTLADIPAAQAVLEEMIRRRAAMDGALVIKTWRDLMPGLYQAIQLDLFSGLIFYLILVFVVAFSILNTFLMSILERTREFGVMMAVGVTPGRLMALVMAESVSMTLIGVIVGILAGIGLTLFFEVHGIDLADSAELLRQYGISGVIYPRLSLPSILIGPAVVLVITFFTALFPALRVRRLRPVAAMAHV